VIVGFAFVDNIEDEKDEAGSPGEGTHTTYFFGEGIANCRVGSWMNPVMSLGIKFTIKLRYDKSTSRILPNGIFAYSF